MTRIPTSTRPTSIFHGEPQGTRIPVAHRPAPILVDGQPYDCCYMEYRDDRACVGELTHSGKYVDMGPREGPPLPMAIVLCAVHADCAAGVFSE